MASKTKCRTYTRLMSAGSGKVRVNTVNGLVGLSNRQFFHELRGYFGKPLTRSSAVFFPHLNKAIYPRMDQIKSALQNALENRKMSTSERNQVQSWLRFLTV